MKRAACILPTMFGNIQLRAYEGPSEQVWFALIFGLLDEHMYCRIHDACVTSEIFCSNKCDCALQLKETMKYMSENGGIVIYTPMEGRGNGILKKTEAYGFQFCDGLDTFSADEIQGHFSETREYVFVKQIFEDLGIKGVTLITNSTQKIESVRALGIPCTRMSVPFCVPWKNSIRYLSDKNAFAKHNIQLNDLSLESVRCLTAYKRRWLVPPKR